MRIYINLLIINILLFFVGNSSAMDGTLDPSFNGTGSVTTVIGTLSAIRSVVIQTDGKIVVAGLASVGGVQQFAIARYNTNGTLDTTFNGTGIVTTLISTLFAQAEALVLQPDGKIIVAGVASISGSNQFAIVRYNSDGTLDTTFNGTGIVSTLIGLGSAAAAVKLQPDGKIVAAGQASVAGVNQFAVVRYNRDGSLDTTFNSTGIVTTAIGTFDIANGLAIQADGKIVLAGFATVAGVNRFALVRYNSDGTLDTTFNSTGILTTVIGANSRANGLTVQADGKIVAVGRTAIAGVEQIAIARYNSDGTLDTTFNTTGITTTIVGTGSLALGVAIQADGKIVVDGEAIVGGIVQIVVARYTTAGILDTTFNGTGVVTTMLGTTNSGADIALQGDGKIVAVGFSVIGGINRFAIARYINSPVLIATEITFPTSGSTIATASPVITGTAQNPSNVTLFLDGIELLPGTVTVGTANQWTYTLSAPLSNGPHTIVAVSDYKAGQVNFASAPVVFTVDTIGPVVTIINPVNGSTIQDNTPTISGTASGGAVTVDIAIDGVTVASNIPVIAGAWSYTLSAAQALSEGSHQIEVIARDAVGNTSVPAISNFIVATVIPIPAAPVIAQPVNGSVLNTRTPTIAGTADALAVAVDIFIDGVFLARVPVINGTWSYTLTAEQALSQGFHSIVAVAINSAGNASEPSNRVVFEVLISLPPKPLVQSCISAAIQAKYCPLR